MNKVAKISLGVIMINIAIAAFVAGFYFSRGKSEIGVTLLRTTNARDCLLGAVGAPPKRQPYVDWSCVDKVATDWMAGAPNADAAGIMAVILRAVHDGSVKTPIRKPGEED